MIAPHPSVKHFIRILYGLPDRPSSQTVRKRAATANPRLSCNPK